MSNEALKNSLERELEWMDRFIELKHRVVKGELELATLRAREAVSARELAELRSDPRLKVPLDGPGSHRSDLQEQRALRAERDALLAELHQRDQKGSCQLPWNECDDVLARLIKAQELVVDMAENWRPGGELGERVERFLAEQGDK